jgi:hypothetical protein
MDLVRTGTGIGFKDGVYTGKTINGVLMADTPDVYKGGFYGKERGCFIG